MAAIPDSATVRVFYQVIQERGRQIEKWGDQSKLDCGKWALILGEEFGEVCRAALEGKRSELDTELVHVMTVCLAWLEAIRA